MNTKMLFSELELEQVIEYLKSGATYFDKMGNRFWIINQFLVMTLKKGKPVKTSMIRLWDSYAKFIQREGFYYIIETK